MNARRPYGTGGLSVVNRANGQTYWKASETVELAPGLKPVRVYGEGQTAKAAKEALVRNITRRKVAAGLEEQSALVELDKPMLLEEWLDLWLLRKTKLSAGTKRQYEASIRNYLKPKFGKTPLRLITSESIHDWLYIELPSRKRADGSRLLADTAIRSLYFLLSSAFDDAIKHDKMTVNPCSKVEVPTRTKRSKSRNRELAAAKNWVPQHLMKHIQGTPDEARHLLALFALRQSEALGITLDSITFGSRPTLVIDKQLLHESATHGCGEYDAKTRKWACGRQADNCPKKVGESRFYLSHDLKTHDSERVIPLVEPLLSALKAQVARQELLHQLPQFDPLPGLENLLFTTDTGRPRRHQYDRREWNKLLEEAEVPVHLRLHDARHLALSAMLGLGIPQDQIMKVAGWSPRTLAGMMEVYTHTGSEYLREGLTQLGESYLESPKKPVNNTMPRL